MGRIKKVAGPKHEATVSPAVAEFVVTGCAISICKLPNHLESFPKGWPFPRGDLYHWIALLNRFDSILELFNLEYGLQKGPQTQPFGRVVLEKGVAQENKSAIVENSSSKELDDLGYSSDGDRQLIESILRHCQTLLENCGNRSLYNSSERLGEILNTTSLSLLSATLQVTARLAQRYHTSRQRSGTSNQHLSTAMLASHYNIDLDKVQKLANPFVRNQAQLQVSTNSRSEPQYGKESSNSSQQNHHSIDPNDLLGLLQGRNQSSGSGPSIPETETKDVRYQELGAVHMSYYQPAQNGQNDSKSIPTVSPSKKATSSSRPRRLSNSEDPTDLNLTPTSMSNDEINSGAMKVLEMPASKIYSTPIQEVIKEGLDTLPPGSAYEFLTRVRIAAAMGSSLESRQEIVKVRLLAIMNLAFIYPEAILQQKILQQDADEPRSLQLVHQLTAILHPPSNGAFDVPVKLQTVALGTLEILAKHKSKEPDVCSALSINVNHGVLFYVLRKIVAEMSHQDEKGAQVEEMERREAVLSLLDTLPKPTNRAGENLIGAGLFDILIDILNLRTAKAERHFPKVISILITVIQAPRESLQTFANAKGLDSVSNLMEHEVQSSLNNAENGRGLPKAFRNQTIDYQIPYPQRETLRLLCRCISSMMSNNGGNFDRLMRNLIDSTPLLGGLRTIIRNPKVYGASVWSGSVNIMSSFIHNEPTSYSIISESGLSNSLFESITGDPVESSAVDNEQDVQNGDNLNDSRNSASTGSAEVKHPTGQQSGGSDSTFALLAKGILPHVDAILAIPQAFGAICLNHSGKQLLLSSHALSKFFEVFESAEHTKAMNIHNDYDTPRLLGSAFDELVRHHPDLKPHVLDSITQMMDRVAETCNERGAKSQCGAKLWVQRENGPLVLAGDSSVRNSAPREDDGDVLMADAASEAEVGTAPALEPNSDALAKAHLSNEDEKEGLVIANFIEISMRFLAGLFENAHLVSAFVERHGAPSILQLATMRFLPYDFNNHAASQEIAKVVHMLAEQKPHLVLPDLLSRTLEAAESLRPLYECETEDGFFEEFIVPGQNKRSEKTAIGSGIARSLVNVQTLCNVLYEVFSPPILNPRTTHTPFSQVNLTDIYEKVIQRLGLLHRVCVWEEILLQKRLPDAWREATRIKGYGMGSEEADEVFGFISTEEESNEDNSNSASRDSNGDSSNAGNVPPKLDRKPSISKDEGTSQFKNARTLRYLLSQIPSCIVPFFQGLGKSLVAKRRPETYSRQNAYTVALAMSRANIDQLDYKIPKNAASAKDRYAYWIVILTSISQLVIDGAIDRPHVQVLTLILQAFKDDGGLDLVREILNVFNQEVYSFHTSTEDGGDTEERAAKLTSAYGGIKIILSFYAQITAPKSITDSAQSHAITSGDRDRANAYFFSAQQFLVELRMAILPDVTMLWDSEFVDKASTSIIKCLIEILTTILEGSDEHDAFRRGDEIPAKKKASHKIFSIPSEKVRSLMEREFDKDLATEALYRCMNNPGAASEYCAYWSSEKGPSRLPIPACDLENPKPPVQQGSVAAVEQPSIQVEDSSAQTELHASAQTLRDQATTDAADGLFLLAQGGHDNQVTNTHVEVEESEGSSVLPGTVPPPPAPRVPGETDGDADDSMQMSLDPVENAPAATLQGQESSNNAAPEDQALSNDRPLSASKSKLNEDSRNTSKTNIPATVDHLNDERLNIKRNLVERILDVLNVHDDVTFELANLISAAAMKDTDDVSTREDIGETLVEALISFTEKDDFRSSGKKIASYAHLLGICLQEDKFFEASLDCLKQRMGSLFSFIKIFPDQTPDQPAMWIGSILLVIERVLSEDVQPTVVRWTAPNPDEPVKTNEDAMSLNAPLIPLEEKTHLTEALLEIMPRIGKDESLVLSVVRALVILTRHRQIASKISDKRNIQRLFVMIKQISGITNQKLPGTFMILLRHMIEDDDTVKQIMRSEIAANFGTRPGQYTDTTAYIAQMSHLILRSPELFVEVTNEMLEITRYEKDQRRQNLNLKPITTPENADETNASPASKIEEQADGGLEPQASLDPKPSENAVDQSQPTKGKPTETKAPVVDQPSGVVHYLLTELLAYKDVEDKETPVPTKSISASESTEEPSDPNLTNGSASPTPTAVAPDTSSQSDNKKVEKPEFRMDQHPIHIYKCFILQCLTELLQSYNRVKIEFINFSRKADPKSMTPSKPRSGVLSYLLNDVIPVGTLNHEDNISFKKKTNTSNWAISTIVALCLKTNEAGYESKPGAIEEDDQTDLLFIRKFVLEHALKAYKDATSSDEHPDVKYARLLDLADLFQRLLLGRLVVPLGPIPQNTEAGFRSIAKLMYEKNFISALTASIADIDLNFPGSKRAIKYILRPLKQLTQTAISLSETSSISSALEQTDEDEISTASSVSDVADEREETPDLFRNSTLGMFEPGRDEESGSGSSGDDDEMYDDDEEDEVIGFDEEMDRGGDEVVSEEDEELDEAGPIEGLHGEPGMDVEVVIDGEDDEVSDDDDDEDDDDDDEDDDDDDVDDSDDMDDGEDIEVLDEVTGDGENASLGEGEEDWGEDQHDEAGDYEMHREIIENRAESAVRDIIQEFSGANTAIHIEGLEGGASDLQMDINDGRYMDDVIRHEEDEEEQDDEEEGREEEVDDEEEIYQPDFDEDDDDHGLPDQPWDFDPDEPFGNDPHHHHHHHHHHHRHLGRRLAEPWNMFPNGPAALRGSMPLYRSHRPGAGVMRSSDDGGHPLLQRGGRNSLPGMRRGGRSALSDAAANLSDYWVDGMEIGAGPRGTAIDSPVSFVNSIIAAIGNGTSSLTPIGGGNGAIHVQIGRPGQGTTLSTHRGILPDLQALLGPRHTASHEANRGNRDEQSTPAVIFPESTTQRWQEEARLIWTTAVNEKALRILDALLRVLVPPAIEKKLQQEEAAKRLKEEQDKAREEERQTREKAEQERLAKEEKEREEAERALQEAAAEAQAENEISSQGRETREGQRSEPQDRLNDGAMEGIEVTQTEGTVSAEGVADEEPEAPPAESSQPSQRIVTRLGDREIDITGLGIDLAYLDALPEDIRQEVLMSQIAIQRSQAAAAGDPPTEISHEFLEALPADIREELLQQEAQDRRRREREEARRQQQQTSGPPRAEDMDPASFLASLDPTLRQHVLAEQDEEMLAYLPPDIAAEARALGGDRSMHRFAGMPGRRAPGLSRLLDTREDPNRPSPAKKAPKRQVVQMLDKAGVATLLRLIFAQQQGSSRDSFNAILRHISENRQTRAEVVSLLLSILQDGSFDVSAVERSFAQLSLRAKQSAVPKTPQPLKRTLTGPIASATGGVEVPPLTVVQQCLSTLVSLTQANPHIPSFFLTEHDLAPGIKSKTSRKGKSKDTKAAKFPLNALLSLLDRKLIMESSACLEQLASLLQSVTHPLNMLLRAQSQEAEEDAEEKANAASLEQSADPPRITGSEPNSNSAAQVPRDIEPPEPADAVMEGMQATEGGEQPDPNHELSNPANQESKQAESDQAEAPKKAKKPRSLSPPIVPEENLRLVVSIIAARECTKRTFQQTVATISNLKAIPGAKEVFGKGLIEQAQDLGQSIREDLDELLPQIKHAESGTDIQGVALPKFATASSHQSKLLRVLTALDYLFGSSKDSAKAKLPETNSNTSAVKDDDMLTSLYENSTFGPLWDKLSECLSAIRQVEGMLNIASILQPLIEALMVVCKKTALKDNAVAKSSKEFSITSPAPESRMESLFFRFTEEHRKVLNELVRHSPKLMMGTFSILVNNPKVLEFDNKRNYFTRRLHSRGELRHPQPPLQLSVRRELVFLDSFKNLSFKSGDEIKYGKLSIRFHGEEGVDAGGVTREWFQVLSRQMFNPDYALFIPVASDRTTFHPNKLSKVNEEHLMFFKFIGRIIGKALYEGRALDCHFSRAVYKRILGKAVSIKDMETLDLDYYKSLLWMLENDIEEIITETFSIEVDDFGDMKVVDLVENGRNIPVTEENKQEYVQRVVEYRLTGSVQTQLEKFLEGFHDIVSPELIQIFNEQELELLISGLPDIDVDDWKNHTDYHNYQASSPQIQWFWRAVRSFDKEERAKLLQFVTGTSKVPLNGFGQLEGMNGFSRFNIHRDYGNKERLPSSHTCFNQLDLPEYESYDSLRSHLYTAMTAGSEYFGFA